MKLWCRLGFHTWHQWNRIKYGNITEDGYPVGHYELYRLQCECCGKVKFKRIES